MKYSQKYIFGNSLAGIQYTVWHMPNTFENVPNVSQFINNIFNYSVIFVLMINCDVGDSKSPTEYRHLQRKLLSLESFDEIFSSSLLLSIFRAMETRYDGWTFSLPVDRFHRANQQIINHVRCARSNFVDLEKPFESPWTMHTYNAHFPFFHSISTSLSVDPPRLTIQHRSISHKRISMVFFGRLKSSSLKFFFVCNPANPSKFHFWKRTISLFTY